MTLKNNTDKLKRNIFFKKIILVSSFLFLFLLASFGFFILNRNNNFRNTIALATTVKPETFTELYFENNVTLPSSVNPYQPYYFRFTIHNIENKVMTYPYEVYLQAGMTKLFIDKKIVTIKNNQFKTIKEGFLVNAPIVKKTEIFVILNNKNQHIDFWIQTSPADINKTKNQVNKIINNKIPTPTASLNLSNTTLPLALPTIPLAASTSATTKEFGGWYWNSDANKAMVWLGKNNDDQDIWSDSEPK